MRTSEKASKITLLKSLHLLNLVYGLLQNLAFVRFDAQAVNLSNIS